MQTHDRATTRILRGPLGFEVARFGVPLALGMGLQTTFNLVDAYLISRLEAQLAGPSLGAIGICDQIAALGTIISYGVSIATAAMVATRHGRGEGDEVRSVAWQSLLLVGVLGLVFGLIGIGFAGTIMHDLVGAKGEVAELGTTYLRVIVGGSYSIFFLLQVTAIQRALGSSKTPVVMLVSANVINLVLAVLLVYGPGDAPTVFSWGPPIARLLHLPRMELIGAAWATVIARTVVLVPLIVAVEWRFKLVRKLRSFAPDAEMIRRILQVAWPASTQLVVRILAMLVTHSLVARAFTTATDQRATIALGVVFRLETLALFVGMGWGSAAQTFVAQNLGAGQRPRAIRSGWLSAGYNALAMIALAVTFRFVGETVVAFFTDEPTVVQIAMGYLRTVSPSYIALGIGIVLGSAMQGAGQTRLTMIIDAIVMVVFQLPFSILAVTGQGASPVRLWWVVVATSVVLAASYIVVYRRGRFALTTA
ncbi:MAG: MATE family efflux transporter [Deltaproteobacteria bacterium]|nr:MATE family efflux transporter [Deltaproteobacteria bacterium]